MIGIMSGIGRIRTYYETEGRRLARWFAGAVRVTRISPNAITIAGSALNLVAAWLVFEQEFLAAAAVFLLGSLLDAMDGAVAIITDKVTPFGGFLDSTLDRVSEGFVLTGIGLMFANEGNLWPVGACFVALASSYLVSYTRAKAEAIGVECKAGLASRFERVVVITLGLGFAAIDERVLEGAVYLLAATATLTVIQRILHVARATRPVA
jgi:CDP-diacylglycerol--glycerol-3-phosphate 3-phosphatidyltransferase